MDWKVNPWGTLTEDGGMAHGHGVWLLQSAKLYYTYSGRGRKWNTTWFFLFISEKNDFLNKKKHCLVWGGLWPITLLHFRCSWSQQPASWAWTPPAPSDSPYATFYSVEWKWALGFLNAARSQRRNNRRIFKIFPVLHTCSFKLKYSAQLCHNQGSCYIKMFLFHFLPRRLYLTGIAVCLFYFCKKSVLQYKGGGDNVKYGRWCFTTEFFPNRRTV